MSIGNLILLTWLWGISIHIWRKKDIEFIYLLDLNLTGLYSFNKPERIVYSSTADITIVYLLTFIAYTRGVRHVNYTHGTLTYSHTLPLFLVIYTVYLITYPLKTRYIWYKMLYNVYMAPFFPVTFRDGFIGDLLTSLVRVFIPLFSGIIYILIIIYSYLLNNFSYISTDQHILWWEKTVFFRVWVTPFFTLFPLWIRLLQCLRRSIETGDTWPYHANSLKYFSAITVISFGLFQPHMKSNTIWLLALVCATVYQYMWDITMDWGLVSWSLPVYTPVEKRERGWYGIIISYITSPMYIKVRQQRLLGPLWVYLAAIIFNLVFRFAWVLTIWPYTYETSIDSGAQSDVSRIGSGGGSGSSSGDAINSLIQAMFYHAGPLVASAELIRRMVWCWLRVEYEYIVTYTVYDSGLADKGQQGTSTSTADVHTLRGGDVYGPAEVKGVAQLGPDGGESAASEDKHHVDTSILVRTSLSAIVHTSLHPYDIDEEGDTAGEGHNSDRFTDLVEEEKKSDEMTPTSSSHTPHVTNTSSNTKSSSSSNNKCSNNLDQQQSLGRHMDNDNSDINMSADLNTLD